MPAADRTLQLIADTLAATEDTAMTDQPRTDDRIPLRTELSTAGLLDHVTRDRDEARTDLGQALAQLTDAWAALNAAGYAHPVASVADLIRQCAADRDAAVSRLNHTRTTAHKLEVERDDLRIQLHREQADGRAMMRDRDEVIRERDKARATITAQAAQLRATGTLLCRLRDLAEEADRAWAAYDGTAERDDCERLADETEVVPSRHDWLPDHDDLCVTCHLPDGKCPASPALRTPPPSPGSGPTRAQGQPEPPPGAVSVTQTEQIDLLGGALDAARRDLAQVSGALTREEQGHAETAADRDRVEDLADRLSDALAEAMRTFGPWTRSPSSFPWLGEQRVVRWRVLLAEYARCVDRDATLAQIEHDAAQHQDAVDAGTAVDEMTPAYPASSPANTREG